MLGVVWKGPKEGDQGQERSFLDTSLCDTAAPTRRATSLELPMAMRFRHLKKTSKEAVGVYRLVGLGGGCPLGGWTGTLVWGCLGSIPLPPELALAHPTLQICHPWAGPVL